ncbi:MAG: spore protease YyaC [Firmicutes bacterium]|nr:spore protease YyaC [Bacillota bacterium]
MCCEDPLAVPKLAAVLCRHFQELSLGKPLLILCIGTDRSTGDSLGPLTGTCLGKTILPGITVLGTLEAPVHAANLKATLREIQGYPEPPLIVALDACLGRLENVGTIAVSRGSLRPGAGVNKDLPPVGDLNITGTVNVGGFMEYFVLQNTRLGLVHKMAVTISTALRRGILQMQAAAGKGKEEG